MNKVTLAQIKAMVIEDDPMMQKIILHQLASLNFAVKSATNGREASQMLKEGYDPDLVIVDMIMPEKEGLETIISFKKKKPNMKMIAISGGGSFPAQSLLEYARKFGVDATFTKPIDFDEFEKTIKDLFYTPSRMSFISA